MSRTRPTRANGTVAPSDCLETVVATAINKEPRAQAKQCILDVLKDLMAEMLSMDTRICWCDLASRMTIQLTVSVAKELR